jgi:DNA-binding MarR family transcriptional regulator
MMGHVPVRAGDHQKERSAMMAIETLALRTLLTVARQRDGLDEARCQVVLEFLAAAGSVDGVLQRTLTELGLTEHKFSILVALFALDPAAATPADLSVHTGVTRSAMTALLDALETRGMVARRRDTRDRRVVYVGLTEAGRVAANTALMDYLRTADTLAQRIPPADQAALRQGCALLHESAGHSQPASPSPILP